MDYKQLLEMSLNENSMLKNSLNILSKTTTDAVASADATRLVMQHIANKMDSFVTDLNRFSDEIKSRMGKYERAQLRLEHAQLRLTKKK